MAMIGNANRLRLKSYICVHVPFFMYVLINKSGTLLQRITAQPVTNRQKSNSSNIPLPIADLIR